MTGFEALAQLRYGNKFHKDCLDVIQKELKALEIIKEKRVNTRAFCYDIDLKIFNVHWASNKENKELTQEEYDLLKEVLG